MFIFKGTFLVTSLKICCYISLVIYTIIIYEPYIHHLYLYNY